MNVYIVCETVCGEKLICGVYASYDAARDHALRMAQYSVAQETSKDTWGDDIDNCVTITRHTVV